MRLLLATDAWVPQTNGVVTTLSRTVKELRALGHEVKTITPEAFPNVACPFYPEIKLSLPSVIDEVEGFSPDHIHIATEGPIGLAARNVCAMHNYHFTTSYHTDFPNYMLTYMAVPKPVTWAFLKWFHGAADRVMVTTRAVREELTAQGFSRLVRWGRGVDCRLFRPLPERSTKPHQPVLVYVGRVAKEKNIEAFFHLKWDGEKRVVGGGPMLETYQNLYPAGSGVTFTGPLKGEALVDAFADADVFVFPSKTDTFGLVVLEALACGVPVASYPTPGPVEVIDDPRIGCVDEDLQRAVDEALAFGDPAACRAKAEEWSWERCTREFLENLVAARSNLHESNRR